MLANDQVLNKGRYRIVGNFGHSGSGAIYEAHDTVSNTTVVLRETIGNHGVATSLSDMDAINVAFLDRAKALSEIRHVSLVCVQDYFADIDRQYLVLEPVPGSDMSKLLSPDSPRPSVSQVLAWADQLLDALQFLHTQKKPIIHGNVNPENVRVASDSTVKLVISSDDATTGNSAVNIASVRPEGGSNVNYRPLEQMWSGLDALSQRVILNSYDGAEKWLTEPLTPASDIYSLGATLYAALTGVVPADALDRSIAALEGKPDPLKNPVEINSEVPTEVGEVIMKAMSLKRDDRYYSSVIIRQVFRTAAVRVKERGAGISEDHPVVKAPVVEAKPPVQQEPVAAVPAPPAPESIAKNSDQERRRADADKKAKPAVEDDVLGLLDLPSEPVPVPVKQTEAFVPRIPEANAPETAKQKVAEAPKPAPVEEKVQKAPAPAPASPAVFEEPVKAKESAFTSKSYDLEEAKPANRIPMIAGGAVLAVVAVIGVYMFAFSGSEPAKPAPNTQLSAQPVEDTPLPAEPTPTQEETTNAVAADQTLTPENSATKSAKVAQPGATPEKPKKQPTPAPAAAKTPKKVTMDDLLN